VTFAGLPGRSEARLVPEAGFEFDAFEVSGLPRRPGFALLRALGQSIRAVRAADRILGARRPDIVLGGGGYVSGPMVLAAARRRLPTALLEADAHLGLANRLAAPLARRVFLSFPIEGRESGKYRVTGRPIPTRSEPVERRKARRQLDLPPDDLVLLVFGGSQGARSLNELVVETFGKEGPAVLHLAGERDYPELRGRVSRPGYRLLPFTDDFGAALGAADLALARAGGSVWELAAAGVPAVLVPYPSATADHQTLNARYFARGGGAILVPESELPAVPTLLRSLLEDDGKREEMRAAMLRLARPGAAEEIAEELIALASVESSFHSEPLCRRAARGGTRRRPQSRT
jgi:UDP-N-acetylglucosamine--N-acetylmuramyl-(pentapeptide) pyrophosphoryl-undecaprenol N-acetylglucosamine transferase